MKIKTPPNLNPEETKCFNEIVKPQLEELYSYNYNLSEFENVKLFISKEEFPNNTKKPALDEIKEVLTNMPKKDLASVSDIYFVSYPCKDESEDYTVRGRTLPLIYKILIYPQAHEKLNIVLAHEIGHIIFEKKLSPALKITFASEIITTFPRIVFWSKEKREFFIKEEFANCYDLFVNNINRLRGFPRLHNFFKRFIG